MDKPIWFEKGKYYIHTEKIDAYYDVNEGKFFSVKTGKPYKGVMSGFATIVHQCKEDSFYDNRAFKFTPKELAFIAICNFCTPISALTTEGIAKKIADSEKKLSILTLPEYVAYRGEDIYLTLDMLDKLENIPTVGKVWKEYNQREKKTNASLILDDFRLWVRDYMREDRENQFRALITKYTQNEETIATFQQFYDNAFYNDILKAYLPRAIYYYERGLRDYYKDIDTQWKSTAFTQLRIHFQMCEKMHIKPPKENWFTARCQVLKDYGSWVNATLNEQLAAAQEPKKEQLSFEDDNFIVIVPTTSDEFVQEANAQHNCVNSWYKEMVANKETHVVFVRKKDNPSKSYITCEVKNNGVIKQYLLANNRQCCSGTPEVDFYRAYQNHLNFVWDA